MGLTTSAWFEGSAKSGSYTQKTRKKTISGANDKTGSYTAYGLSPGTKYYYRLAAENDAGASYGSQLTFTTLK